MARGRFLSTSISRNKRLSSLESDRHRLAWFYALPHADRDGYLPGDPHELGCLCYASLLTSHAWTAADIGLAIEALERAGLWMRGVDASGKPVLRIERFGAHQEGMRYERERESEFVEPIQWTSESRTPATAGLTPATSGNFRRPPAQVQGQVQVEGEVQARAREEEPPTGSESLEGRMIAPRVEAAFREALGSPGWKLEHRHRRKIETYALALTSCPDLPGYFRAALEEERENRSDTRWIFENCVDWIVNNPGGKAVERDPYANFKRW